MWRAIICALWLAALAGAPAAQAASRQTSGAGDKALRAAIKTAERRIDARIQQVTSNAPFVLLGTTRGAYLAGYGVVFTLEVNLVPVAAISPFRPAYTAQEIQNLNHQKRQKLGALEASMRQLLTGEAAALTQIPANEKIAIVVTLFNFNWEDTTGLPSQIVMQAARQALVELQRTHAGADAQDRAIEVKEF
ncbi:MAG TPA: hypothetical protein VEU62_17055 [Bryobacterales bacterium]|nr:hypothetical protein [Bryobacterales bacterium]